MSDFSLDRYLRRIGLCDAPPADEAGLAALHEAQTRAIPFENFDVLLGRRLSLEPGALVEKLVDRKRGGYCFELSGLFQRALEALGFRARPLLARVLVGRPPGVAGPRTHAVLLVQIGGRELVADVGFGGGLPHLPLPLVDGIVHEQLGERLRFRRDDRFGWVLQMAGEDEWRDLYALDLAPVHPIDVLVSHHFTSTHPESRFLRAPLVSRPEGEGRVVLSGSQVKVHRAGGTSTEPAPRGPERIGWLADRFGIELDVDPEALPPWDLAAG